MRVVFVQYGNDIACATMMVASCKVFGYEVTQLSDLTSPAVPKVDSVLRREKNEPSMLWRMRYLTELATPYVMLDTDMLVCRDIADGFGDGCDVGLTWREKNAIYMRNVDKVMSMPYNGGVLFVSNGEFVSDCVSRMQQMEPVLQDWFGDQIALDEAVKSGKYAINEIRDRRWNYTPDDPRQFREDVWIYHFKGKRKGMMVEFFKHVGKT